MRARTVVAVRDPALRAQIVERRALVYRDPAVAGDDRPDFVRAASGLAWLGDTMAIVQDDAGFIALLAPDGRLTAIPLPAGPGNRRRFEERLGNKADKLDLEACLSVATPRGPRLLAFGSAAARRREVIAVLEPGASTVRVVDAGALHTGVRAALGGPDVAVNLEGAALFDDRLRLFQRGNGAPAGITQAVDAAIDLDRAAFFAWLDDSGPPPPVLATTWYALGGTGGVRYGFTDVHAVNARDAVFLAAAEDSPNAIDDGAVHGTVIGILAPGGARLTDLLDEDGRPAAVKAEGIALAPGGRAWIVLDADDPDLPAALCAVALQGPWPLSTILTARPQ